MLRQIKVFTLGQEVMYSGFKGIIKEIHTGQLAGMYTIDLGRTGTTCVSWLEIQPLQIK